MGNRQFPGFFCLCLKTVSCANVFDWHENERVFDINVRRTGFSRRFVLTTTQEATRKEPLLSSESHLATECAMIVMP